MEESFNIYKLNHETGGSSSDPEQEDYFELNENFTHLTRLIRSQYFAYLKRIIYQNYTEWKNQQADDNARTITDDYLESCATYFEERAVRYCMVVQLYRKYMLRIISEIRRETTCCELISKLKQYQFKSETKEDVPIGEIKNESEDGRVKFPNVAYKRKLQKTDENSKKLNRFNDTHCYEMISGHETKDNSMEEESASERLLPYINDEPSNESITGGNAVENGNNEVCCWPAQNPALVPYTSDDDSPQQSAHGEANASPAASSDNPPNVEPVQVPYESLSLQEKIMKFEENLQAREQTIDAIIKPPIVRRKRFLPQPNNHMIDRKLSISHPLSPVSTSSEEDAKPDIPHDSIAEDLESLFAEDKKANDVEDIFGDGTYNPEIELILREIENAKVPGCGESPSKANNVARTACKRPAGTERKHKRYKLQPLVCDLRQSLWPCELHLWKQRLREILSQLAEVDIRHHDQIRNRFEQLFGEDSEDEFAPYSPSVELDDVVVASCMKRIAPIIVKHLMHPMKEGLIANRYLFKKLAKKFAYTIVLVDQYADEEQVKEQIDLFFCAGRKVENLIDIESL